MKKCINSFDAGDMIYGGSLAPQASMDPYEDYGGDMQKALEQWDGGLRKDSRESAITINWRECIRRIISRALLTETRPEP